MKPQHDGILLVNKPVGCTSHDVVNMARRQLNLKEIGHAGTLDPLATGLLVLLLGEATKLSDYLLNGDKGYEVEVQLGIETDSYDVTGSVLSRNETEHLTEDQVREAILSMQGPLELEVPMYSAVKVDGVKLVDAVRKDIIREAPSRLMEFYDLEIRQITMPLISLAFSCSKGSYVRSWVQELGRKLGVGAAVKSLNRVYSAPYYLSQAMDLSVLSTDNEKGSLVFETPGFIPLNKCLGDWVAKTVSGRDETLMRNGQIPNELLRRLIPEQKQANQLQRTLGIRVFEGSSGHLLSLMELIPNRAPKIKRVFNVRRVENLLT